MGSYHDGFGQYIRDDDRALRTKLVVTINSPAWYRQNRKEQGRRIIDLAGAEVDPANITYEYLIRNFYAGGVDVVRLNLGHVMPENLDKELAATFAPLEEAILACERRGPRRMTVLADLPGPKIRFGELAEVPVEVGQELNVVLDREIEGGLTVYVDGRPLKQAMDRADERRRARNGVEYAPQLRENVLGLPAEPTAGRGASSFDRLMLEVSARRHDPLLVFVGDGEVVLQVSERFDPSEPVLPCRVVSATTDRLSGRKGFTLKGLELDIPSFTELDEALLGKLLELEYAGREAPGWEPVVGLLGISFAQTADDVLRAREFIERELATRCGMTPRQARLQCPALVAKIETAKGWKNIEFILDVADCAMVARGDLGLQTDVERVPAIQKRLIRLCNRRGKPVITATGMLKSMTECIEPTRAEGSDEFNAIEDGTDAVMVSEETATGRYPFHVVRKMQAIAEMAELYPLEDARRATGSDARLQQRQHEFLREDSGCIVDNERRLHDAVGTLRDYEIALDDPAKGTPVDILRRLEWREQIYAEKLGKAKRQDTTNRITHAACILDADDILAILAPTTSGRTARMIARLRPSIPVIAGAHDVINMRKLLVSAGVIPVHIELASSHRSPDDLFATFIGRMRSDPYLSTVLRDGRVIFTAGTPLRRPGTTNLVQLRDVDDVPA